MRLKIISLICMVMMRRKDVTLIVTIVLYTICRRVSEGESDYLGTLNLVNRLSRFKEYGNLRVDLTSCLLKPSALPLSSYRIP